MVNFTKIYLQILILIKIGKQKRTLYINTNMPFRAWRYLGGEI